MLHKEHTDPFKKIGTAWWDSIARNALFKEKMGCTIRQCQLRGIDADSHRGIIKMEKKLGKQLLEVAKLSLEMGLKAINHPYELELQYSDRGIRINQDMSVGSFWLGHCFVRGDDPKQDNKPVALRCAQRPNGADSRVSRLYAAAYIDTYGHRKIMYLFDYGNKQSRLLEAVRHEVSKYGDTLGAVHRMICSNPRVWYGVDLQK